MELKQADSGRHAEAACADLPELKRLNYFYGQMLGVNDFRTEQAYFRDKLKLHNRCLHGFGTVCGLKVVPEQKPSDCAPESDGKRKQLEAELAKLTAEAKAAHATGDEAKASELLARAEGIRRELDPLHAGHCDEE